MTVSLHRLAEERSLALHREVVARARRDPRVLEEARARVKEWLAAGEPARAYALAWAEILARPAEAIFAVLVDEGERARALRQVTPFAGVVDPRTRWRIWREVRDQLGVA